MRHGNKLNKLSRTKAHRIAMMANMGSSLIKHKHITTTVAKAKALRVFIEPIITRSKEATMHNYRTAFSYLKDKVAVNELFKVVGDKVSNRNGGYTRILKVGNRAGDNAEMALIELVDFNEFFDGFNKDSKAATTKKTRRGKTKSTEATAQPAATKQAKVAAPIIEEAEVVVVESAAPVIEATNSVSDDLTVIDGIGPAFAERLNKVGIFTFQDLVNLNDEKIAAIEESDSMTSPEEWTNWINQAKEKLA